MKISELLETPKGIEQEEAFQNTINKIITSRVKAIGSLVEYDLMKQYIIAGSTKSYSDFLAEAAETYEIDMIERNGGLYYAGLTEFSGRNEPIEPTEDSEPPEEDRLLSRKEVKELLGVAESTLSNWTINGHPKLPFYRIGHLIKYKRSEVLEFINRNRAVK